MRNHLEDLRHAKEEGKGEKKIDKYFPPLTTRALARYRLPSREKSQGMEAFSTYVLFCRSSAAWRKTGIFPP